MLSGDGPAFGVAVGLLRGDNPSKAVQTTQPPTFAPANSARVKKWVLKAVVQKTISYLPGKHRLNYLFQRYVTRGVQLSDAYFTDKLLHFREHSGFLERCGADLTGKTTLELGTGWYPVVPLCCFLMGAERMVSVDISELMSVKNLRDTAERLLRAVDGGETDTYFTPRSDRVVELRRALAETTTRADLLARLRFDYRTTDARYLELPPASVDFFHSNNVFEHIYFDVLEDILRHFQTLAAPGARMSHFVDMSDHFAHLDARISIYHFLKYDERTWRRIDNDIQPQNRRRLPHYRDLYDRLALPLTETRARPGDLDALRAEPLDAEFAALPEAEVAKSHAYLFSQLP